MDINEATFPEAQEGDRVLWEDEQWYVYTNGTWILES